MNEDIRQRALRFVNGEEAIKASEAPCHLRDLIILRLDHP